MRSPRPGNLHPAGVEPALAAGLTARAVLARMVLFTAARAALTDMKKQSATPANAGRKKVTFAWPSSDGAAAVAGDFNNWEHLPLKPQGSGMARTMYLPPGDYQYRFVVNGEWHSDPSCTEAVGNPFGTSNSLLHVA
jgi:1,4-alpha-glucan branching enzyme